MSLLQPVNNPAKPAPGDPFDANLIRAQLKALKAEIDALAAQIANTSSNSNAVANLSLTLPNNPPNNFEVQPIADKVDELINALRK